MKRLLFAVFVFGVGVAFSAPAFAGGHRGAKRVPRVPAGKIAYHFVIDRQPQPDGAVELVGYIARIEGFDGPMFTGAPCPNLPPFLTACVENAHFTVRVRQDPPGRVTPLILADGNTSAVLVEGIVFDIFYDESPDQSWGDFDSFSNGEVIATFVEGPLLAAGSGGSNLVLFSSDLEWATDLRIGDQILNFRRLVPGGITSTNFGPATPPDQGSAAVGTAIAIAPSRRRH